MQYALHSGYVYGEVGSRQWEDPERPLSPGAVAALEKLGFSGGGPERNFAADNLAPSRRELAELTDALFFAAYELDGFSAVVHEFDLNDITFRRAQAFTRDMIVAHVKDVGVHYLRDEMGDVRVDLQCDGWDQPVTVWLIAEGDGDTIHRIVSHVPVQPASWTRADVLERCNTWNREHRWPKAVLIDEGAGFRIITSRCIDLVTGVTPALLVDFTHDTLHGVMEFWSWMAAAGKPSTSDARGELVANVSDSAEHELPLSIDEGAPASPRCIGTLHRRGRSGRTSTRHGAGVRTWSATSKPSSESFTRRASSLSS